MTVDLDKRRVPIPEQFDDIRRRLEEIRKEKRDRGEGGFIPAPSPPGNDGMFFGLAGELLWEE